MLRPLPRLLQPVCHVLAEEGLILDLMAALQRLVCLIRAVRLSPSALASLHRLVCARGAPRKHGLAQGNGRPHLIIHLSVLFPALQDERCYECFARADKLSRCASCKIASFRARALPWLRAAAGFCQCSRLPCMLSGAAGSCAAQPRCAVHDVRSPCTCPRVPRELVCVCFSAQVLARAVLSSTRLCHLHIPMFLSHFDVLYRRPG